MEKLLEQIWTKELEQIRHCDTRQHEEEWGAERKNRKRLHQARGFQFNLDVEIEKLKRMTIIREALHILLSQTPSADAYLDLGEYSKPGERLVLLDHEIGSTVSILHYMDGHMARPSLFAYEPPVMATAG
ncbi:hypothetical protein COCC4DRAFT_145425 [Bipolaris maydis ATCC 48331]|uniref:Uncharacterized protein n=2 Tax=Cochliobolus heterostrophus TaxID=5016 RepID=M2U061_COCH5|nr:uncharacterized protein COCC4DRAFT_145425 [Bipolaris maydis ATCC 48331]EMD91919.1 hypothetical protein COCHEDRAFT_1213018 [Bipolaris maydis C5]KAH7553157.1 hypothetical protein BM1_08130 [Bipolaris maydis]ENI02597.1 hypothetical protein COCC4DRAFT_145425 [Bipolaris maydis ATCC 48331]KAJ5021466.1 hypothetical protein J3E73DRAFT_375473 [Bipolaris maydis]KAJ6210530.1 hypothetical protein PSV09DRAFT_1213018 [Bipolaris maydis]